MPPWAGAEVVARSGSIQDGGRVTLGLKVAAFPVRWELEHFGYREGSEFRDRQVQGPFGHWEHIHRVEPDGPQGAWLEDRISYTPAGRRAGRSAGARAGAGSTGRDLCLSAPADRPRPLTTAEQSGGTPALRSRSRAPRASSVAPSALFSGPPDTGCSAWCAGGAGSAAPSADEIPWDPEGGRLDPARLEGVDAVIHLAGENAGAGRWTAERKRRIPESRSKGTSLLAETLARLKRPPAGAAQRIRGELLRSPRR